MKGQSEDVTVEVKVEVEVDLGVEDASIQEEKCVRKATEDNCKCDQCPYEQHRYEKPVHYTKAQENKKFKCNQCPYAAFQNGHLKQHIVKVHNACQQEHKQKRKMSKTMSFLKQHQLPRPWGLMYKRKLIWDEQKVMSNLEMSMNIKDTSDTLATAISMTPPTKFLMHWRKNGGVERIMGAPGKTLNSGTLLSEYKNRLIAEAAEDECFNMLGDDETLPLGPYDGTFKGRWSNHSTY